eukprot:CAMPEP_0204349506 /NCGR_PEP_ID=MMETSP0469-20131031/29579_1 /ASSEMBLY_ACC=CAM_ASM_000384 /TAXON_ID=2969 /ORGANISM="Oxyrrhis marina" /LENGTH=480 /DNA_ID=CAMNT_0051335709 /DNA_START=12 /DNA_END=1450 /DNA_ORIENTATION=-
MAAACDEAFPVGAGLLPRGMARTPRKSRRSAAAEVTPSTVASANARSGSPEAARQQSFGQRESLSAQARYALRLWMLGASMRRHCASVICDDFPPETGPAALGVWEKALGLAVGGWWQTCPKVMQLLEWPPPLSVSEVFSKPARALQNELEAQRYLRPWGPEQCRAADFDEAADSATPAGWPPEYYERLRHFDENTGNLGLLLRALALDVLELPPAASYWETRRAIVAITLRGRTCTSPHEEAMAAFVVISNLADSCCSVRACADRAKDSAAEADAFLARAETDICGADASVTARSQPPGSVVSMALDAAADAAVASLEVFAMTGDQQTGQAAKLALVSLRKAAERSRGERLASLAVGAARMAARAAALPNGVRQRGARADDADLVSRVLRCQLQLLQTLQSFPTVARVNCEAMHRSVTSLAQAVSQTNVIEHAAQHPVAALPIPPVTVRALLATELLQPDPSPCAGLVVRRCVELRRLL